MPTLSRDGAVFVLRFSEPADPAEAPENAFSPDFLESFESALDEVESSVGPAALVTTGAGKFYSNGLDLGIVGGESADLPSYVTRVHAVFARMMRLETPTVAAVNGHAFGAGAMLVLCQDHRAMRADRGFWSLPEAALGMPFPAGMNSLVVTRLGDATASTAMLTSRRYPAAEAVAGGIVHESVDAERLLERSEAVAAGLAPMRGANYAGIRTGILAGVLAHLDQAVSRV